VAAPGYGGPSPFEASILKAKNKASDPWGQWYLKPRTRPRLRPDLFEAMGTVFVLDLFLMSRTVLEDLMVAVFVTVWREHGEPEDHSDSTHGDAGADDRLKDDDDDDELPPPSPQLCMSIFIPIG